MIREILENLVEDADRVADTGVRLGRIRNPEFLKALSAARRALASNDESESVTAVADLQGALNVAIRDLSPITMSDLRSGWRPFGGRPEQRLGTFMFGLLCFILLVATAYSTQIYDRAVALYATTLELQDARGAEQAIRLLGLLRKNQKDVVESLTSGNKDFLYESFNKALFDLHVMNERFVGYAPRAASVLDDLNMVGKISDVLFFPLRSVWGTDRANPTDSQTIKAWMKNYGTNADPSIPTTIDCAGLWGSNDVKTLDIQSLLVMYIRDVRCFTSTINVGFDPLSPNNYYYYVYQLREGIGFLGSWVLPWLYGMLGAVIFHMRRLLDPRVPNPTWLRFGYRIVLGGFAGIIVVWFLTPGSQKLAQPAFATLTSFGLAFLVGFSTDVFFQALDRLVSYLSQAVGEGTAQAAAEHKA
jgi:hypothetical protein